MSLMNTLLQAAVDTSAAAYSKMGAAIGAGLAESVPVWVSVESAVAPWNPSLANQNLWATFVQT